MPKNHSYSKCKEAASLAIISRFVKSKGARLKELVKMESSRGGKYSSGLRSKVLNGSL